MLKYISAPIIHDAAGFENSYSGVPLGHGASRASHFETEEEALKDAKNQCLKSTNPFGVFKLITEVNPPEVRVTAYDDI